MPSTAKGLPYPAATDLVTAAPAAFQALADATDARLTSSTIASTSAGTGILQQSGWVLASVNVWKITLVPGLALVQLRVLGTRAAGSATLTATAAGNVTDSLMFSIPAAYRPPYDHTAPIQVFSKAPAFGQVTSDGQMVLMEMAPGATFVAGDEWRVNVTYLVTA